VTGQLGRYPVLRCLAVLGFKSLEDKLRAAGASSAPASVLDCKVGVGWSTGQRGDPSGDQTKYSYTLNVQPPGEPPFEAHAAIRAHRLDQMPDVGQTVTVLYDPANHSKVAFDTAATNRQVLDQISGHVVHMAAGSDDDTGEEISKLKDLAEMHASGALTDEEFAREKAKLLGE
jgi:hypothetical protein